MIAGLHISALSHPPTGFIPKPVAIFLPPSLTALSVLIRHPSPLLPYAPDSLLPFIPARAFWTLQAALPVNHTFCFSSPSTAYTCLVIDCPPPCLSHPSSVLQTSVGPGLLIPSAFYPPPSTNPPNPLYLTHKTPPTLTHWWFSTWRAQSRHPTDGPPPLMHQPINLHLPSP